MIYSLKMQRSKSARIWSGVVGDSLGTEGDSSGDIGVCNRIEDGDVILPWDDGMIFLWRAANVDCSTS